MKQITLGNVTLEKFLDKDYAQRLKLHFAESSVDNIKDKELREHLDTVFGAGTIISDVPNKYPKTKPYVISWPLGDKDLSGKISLNIESWSDKGGIKYKISPTFGFMPEGCSPKFNTGNNTEKITVIYGTLETQVLCADNKMPLIATTRKFDSITIPPHTDMKLVVNEGHVLYLCEYTPHKKHTPPRR